MRKQQHIFSKTFVVGLAFAIFATGCTKKRDAVLPEAEESSTFAISDFGTDLSGFQANTKTSDKALTQNFAGNKATEEKGLVNVDTDNSAIPARLKFMFEGLDIAGQEQPIKVVFAVDSKFVTAYKLSSTFGGLTKLEKQLAVSSDEVKYSIDIQKAINANARKAIVTKMAAAQRVRTLSFANNTNINVLVPLFKYPIVAKGILERVKNELRENTSTLALKSTEFSQATHIKIDASSDARKDVGSVDQRKQLDQLYTTDSLDNKTWTASELQSQFDFKMKFVADNARVLTRLDNDHLKVFQIATLSALNEDEKRQFLTGTANGEILKCTDSVNNVQKQSKDCVMRLVAKVPLTYKNLNLTLADSRSNTDSKLELLNVSKKNSKGLVEIINGVRAERARPTGVFDPLNTIKMSDLKGEFYFRRTFEDASNMMLASRTGTSGDLSVVKFEFEKDRVVVRNQKALVQYIGQGPKDKEELMVVPVNYFKLETLDTDGAKLSVARLVGATANEADYIEIDWTKNTVPIANSPLAFFAIGNCWQANTSSTVQDPDNRLSKNGILNFSLAGSYTVKPNCANQSKTNDAYFSLSTQFNYNVVERLSFRKRTNPATDDQQFAPSISPTAQNAMNFAIFTLADSINSPEVRQGREGSEVYKPVIHDFRNGKVLNYWIGGLKDAPAERKAIITQAAVEVVAEWNEAFRRALKGSDLYRDGDYIVLNSDNEATQHLGDLDKNYLWFMDKVSENNLLGVAQPAPNPFSGTIMANNVIIYSGNTEQQIRAVTTNLKEQRAYEKQLEVIKQQALIEMQTRLEQEKAKAANPTAAATSLSTAAAPVVAPSMASLSNVKAKDQALNFYSSYINKLVLSARPVKMMKGLSKPVGLASRKNLKLRTIISDTKIVSNKDFSRRIIEEALSGEFRNDPLMLEAIISREMVRTQPGLSEEIKELLLRKAELLSFNANFDQSAKKRGGCVMYAREGYNEAYLATDFNEIFKSEIKQTLLHEVGHAIGLIHNFKASFDRKNFEFDHEKTNRNYTSIMDYIAAPEMEYHGPGTYDVHALRAIYAGMVELSPEAKKMVVNDTIKLGEKAVSTVGNQFIKLENVKTILDLTYWNQVQKQVVSNSGLLKHYEQCHDGEVGKVRGCARYDSGSSAKQVVQHIINNYNRLYTTSYSAKDRLNFGWEQKAAIINRSIGLFSQVRSYLDDYFKMLIYKTATSQADMDDFEDAAHLGYDFFHDIIRTPNTNLGFGKTPDEIAKRILPISFMNNIPVMQTDADGNEFASRDKDGVRLYTQKMDVKLLERRSLFDVTPTPGENNFDTLGISYDKEFALEFLLRASPRLSFDNSQNGWFSYNEFEKYILNVDDAVNSVNMETLYLIMSGNLPAGFMDSAHNVVSIDEPIRVNQSLLDSAALGAIASTNLSRTSGLDTFAEFFKVGTLKGGKNITDRLTVARVGQSSSSQVGIKFFAADNANGANFLVMEAKRKTSFLAHSQVIGTTVGIIANGAQAINAKMAELVKANPLAKPADLMASNEDLKKIQADIVKANSVLLKELTDANVDSSLISADEIKRNPNLALDKQISMMQGMIMQASSYYPKLAKALQEKQIQTLQNDGTLQGLQQLKGQNAELAKTDLLGLAQDLLLKAVKDQSIVMKNQNRISGSQVLGMIIPGGAINSKAENLLYAIESLARYTSMINPEYVQ